jgi:hypothetical protein
MVQQIVTVNDVLDGHVALDIECLDRIYLNAYVPVLPTSAQVVAFLNRPDQPQAPPQLRAALKTITACVDDYATRARLPRPS